MVTFAGVLLVLGLAALNGFFWYMEGQNSRMGLVLKLLKERKEDSNKYMQLLLISKAANDLSIQLAPYADEFPPIVRVAYNNLEEQINVWVVLVQDSSLSRDQLQ